MGCEIEKQKLVLKLESKMSEPDYFAVHQIADDNVHPMEFDWCYLGFGWEYIIVGAAGKLAMAVEGGSLKPYWKWVKAEDYIKSWRRAIKNALDFNGFISRHKLRIILAVQKEHLTRIDSILNSDFARKMVQDLIKKYNCIEEKFYSKDIVKIIIDVEDEQALRDFVTLNGQLRQYNILYWRAVEIS